MAVTAEEIKRLKGLGFLNHRGTDRFQARIVTVAGHVSAAQMQAAAEACQKFGNGEIALTMRQSIEIQEVPYEKVEALRAFLTQHGLETGGTGAKVRPVVSCKGSTCHYGLIAVYPLAEEIHKRFYEGWHETKLPHKFKIAVGGCPNNCIKPDLNDIGIIGQRVPAFDLSKCRGCKICQIAKVCPVAAAVPGPDRKVRHDPAVCIHCGRCASVCPFHVVTPTTGYAAYIGGRWGKRCAKGRLVNHLFASEEEVLAFIERTLAFYRDNGQPGERFADTIARLGFDKVEAALL